MYREQLILDLSKIGLNDFLWKKYIKLMKKKYRRLEAIEKRKICVKYDRVQFSEFEIKVMVYGALSEFLDKHQKLVLSRNGFGDKSYNKLPLNLHPESVTYLFYSTRLAILQADDRFNEWLKQYFINIMMFYNSSYINYFFFDEKLESVMELTPVRYEELLSKDIIKYTREAIEDGKYVNIHLDEFYLCEKDYYSKRHYVHESLIYGYDDGRRVFMAYGFTKRQKVAAFEIPYIEYLFAFEKGKLFSFCGADYLEERGYAPLNLCKAKQCPQIEFTAKLFLRKIQEFICPKKSELVGGDKHIYGINLYDHIKKELVGNGLQDTTIDFRVFQLLYEQKICIDKRMEYIAEKYHLKNVMEPIRLEYKSVVQKFDKIRLLYLKQLIIERRGIILTQNIHDKKSIDKIVKELDCGKEKEMEILKQLVNVLCSLDYAG